MSILLRDTRTGIITSTDLFGDTLGLYLRENPDIVRVGLGTTANSDYYVLLNSNDIESTQPNVSNNLKFNPFTGVLSGVSSISGYIGYATSAGISTYATSSGISTYAISSGIATYALNAEVSTYSIIAGYSTSSGIATYAQTAGISTYAQTAGISTYAQTAGISTYAQTAGISTYAQTAGISTYATSSGWTSSGIATYAQGLTGSPSITITDLTSSGNSNLKLVTETTANTFSTTLTPSTGTLTVDVTQGTVVLGTLSSSVTTWAFTNVPSANSKTTTITIIIAGNTSRTYGDACSVNGSVVSSGIKWSGGTAPTSTNNYDIIAFAIVKDSAGTINVFGGGNMNYS
jgi:hypothetical protein